MMAGRRERVEHLEQAVRYHLSKLTGAKVTVNGVAKARFESLVRKAIEEGRPVASRCDQCPLAQQFLDTTRIESEQ